MIRIGIVGCGRILAAHLRGYRLLREAGVDDFEIGALCARRAEDAWGYVDRNGKVPQRRAVSDIPGDPLGIGEEYLSDFQDVGSVKVYTDFRELISDGSVDAVNDYTTHGMHHVVGLEALRNGKHLMSQKPLGVTVRAARRMCDAAEEAGVTFGVCENLRNAPEMRRVQWAFSEEEGVMGDFQMALLGNVGTWWAPDLVVAETPWRHRLVEGGGISLDLGVHQFDMIRSVAGEVKSVTARTAVVEPVRFIRHEDGSVRDEVVCDADDVFYASFETVKGGTGTLFGSWAGHGTNTEVGEGPVFYGSNGRVSGGKVHRDGGGEESLEGLYEAGASEARKARDRPKGLTDDFALAQHDWLEAIRRGGQPETSGREGLIDLACAYAIVESAKAGRTVEVEEVMSGELRAYQEEIDARYEIDETG
ncbi:MAG: Gfo/Idh/MocA family oxidoreductase [Verrucomicrobiota bacterium]